MISDGLSADQQQLLLLQQKQKQKLLRDDPGLCCRGTILGNFRRKPFVMGGEEGVHSDYPDKDRGLIQPASRARR